MNADEVFVDLIDLPKWVPYNLIFNPKREKFDKVPNNGRRGLSTRTPTDWCPLLEAIEIAKKNILPGVGIVMTAGIELGGWRLIGLDFDDVNFKSFKLPAKTYAEKSPSETGIRSFFWAPENWAKQYKDTLDAHPKHCKHAEIYVGTSPRFLTVTFNPINEYPIAKLTGKELEVFEGWLNPAEIVAPLKLPEGIGSPVYLPGFNLTDDQKLLVDGRGQLDRSNILHGLLIRLVDGGSLLEDVLATVTQTIPLWQICLDHRHDNATRAYQFAQEEVARAYEKSDTAKRDRLVAYNDDWKKKPNTKEKLEEKGLIPSEKLTFPVELFDNAPGMVGQVAKWIIGASFAPRKEFAYASALSMVACLIGPYCTEGSRDGKLNLYLTLVGDTGTGKNEAIDTMAILLAATDAKDCILDFPASEAAMRRQLSISPNILLRVDELAHKLESMKGSTNGSGLGRAVLEAYNGARMPPKVYADEKKCLPAVENPFVQIIGGTTDKVWDVVKSSHMEDGTLNRFIFVCLPYDPAYSNNPEPSADIPKDLKDRLNAFWRGGRHQDLIGSRKITYDADVKAAINNLNLKAWDFMRKEYGSLYSRLTQNTLKVAGILAAGDGRYKISMTDFEQAKTFMEWSIANTYNKIQARMADTNFERLGKRLLAKLETCKGKLRMRDAYKFMHISRREMEELVTTLQLSGDILIYKDEEAQHAGYIPEWIILEEKEEPAE